MQSWSFWSCGCRSFEPPLAAMWSQSWTVWTSLREGSKGVPSLTKQRLYTENASRSARISAHVAVVSLQRIQLEQATVLQVTDIVPVGFQLVCEAAYFMLYSTLWFPHFCFFLGWKNIILWASRPRRCWLRPRQARRRSLRYVGQHQQPGHVALWTRKTVRGGTAFLRMLEEEPGGSELQFILTRWFLRSGGYGFFVWAINMINGSTTRALKRNEAGPPVFVYLIFLGQEVLYFQ